MRSRQKKIWLKKLIEKMRRWLKSLKFPSPSFPTAWNIFRAAILILVLATGARSQSLTNQDIPIQINSNGIEIEGKYVIESLGRIELFPMVFNVLEKTKEAFEKSQDLNLGLTVELAQTKDLNKLNLATVKDSLTVQKKTTFLVGVLGVGGGIVVGIILGILIKS